MTHDEINKRLKAIEAYEMNIMMRASEEQLPWREEEAIDRELLRLLKAKAKLRAML